MNKAGNIIIKNYGLLAIGDQNSSSQFPHPQGKKPWYTRWWGQVLIGSMATVGGGIILALVF